ncbi:hypothetical protein ACFOWM_03240 [Ferruginibacter yonginensis]|uniref:Lipoprotein n=1 Tax=Ferruginibacter yonginensis TaxID=1310416 RepID=A0ABV8QQG7_9BACT
MKTLLYVILIVMATSCSTLYKNGQTPDDLYAAKGKPVVENLNDYQRNPSSYEKRQIRMGIKDPRWRNLDQQYDYDCTYNPYNYGYNYGYYYNPYFYPYPVYGSNITIVNPKNTAIRKTNLNSYTNTISTYNSNVKTNTYTKSNVIRTYNNSNTNEPTRYPNTSWDTRSFNPQVSNNGSTPGGSGSGTGVSRPSRGQ